ncbi:MAG: LLM class F420-dependent oxidoreductase [Gammaproteobacteria bacterium]|nr:LLM class F420-dependent oxidoreductase [Gammaproteobacteria bacterium]|tara:strand:+ start:2015 stop:3019 length:1005 start_codon:yes stop_codon:yes gene_type:complete
MKLGLGIGPTGAPGGQRIIELAIEAENLGYDTIWCPEIYGMDCFTPLAWVGAHTSRINLGTSIMQISARTPASAAMHAVAMDYLSNGRLILGIGVSGPQVVEGWYGQPYPKPLARTREWMAIFRKIVAREEPVTFDGDHYQLPLDGGTGLGKPLKLMQHPLRDHIPTYLGAEGPKNVALAAEICDGWIPMFLSPYRMNEQYAEAMRIKSADFEIAAAVPVVINDDLDKARSAIKQNVGFYVGGMGARNFNLHKDHVTRMGYGDAAQEIQDLFMSGRRDEAFAAVPDALIDEIALCGPKARIRERLADWKNSPITQMNVGSGNRETMQFFAEELL